jgi:hypothetical protein
MGINTIQDYVKFYLDLKIINSIPFLNFVNNEKMTLKHKLENKKSNKESIEKGIRILEELAEEIKNMGETYILEKYGNKKEHI